MSNLFWLTEGQMARIRRIFRKSHGRRRVDDRRVLSGIIFIKLRRIALVRRSQRVWPPKTRSQPMEAGGEQRSCDRGVFARIMEGLAAGGTERKTIMIDAVYLRHPHGLQPAG